MLTTDAERDRPLAYGVLACGRLPFHFKLLSRCSELLAPLCLVRSACAERSLRIRTQRLQTCARFNRVVTRRVDE